MPRSVDLWRAGGTDAIAAMREAVVRGGGTIDGPREAGIAACAVDDDGTAPGRDEIGPKGALDGVVWGGAETGGGA